MATPQPQSVRAPDLIQALTRNSQLVIKQTRELAEIFLGFETRNKYAIFDETGAPCGKVIERGGGFGSFIKRIFLKSHRPFVIDVLDAAGGQALILSRPFFFFFSDIAVNLPTGLSLGTAHRRFGFLHKKYELQDPNGNVFAVIKTSYFKIWTFAIRDAQGVERSRISKKWAGALKEIFTDADNFLLEFGNAPWSPAQRAVIFAVAISIDFDFFDNNSRS